MEYFHVKDVRHASISPLSSYKIDRAENIASTLSWTRQFVFRKSILNNFGHYMIYLLVNVFQVGFYLGVTTNERGESMEMRSAWFWKRKKKVRRTNMEMRSACFSFESTHSSFKVANPAWLSEKLIRKERAVWNAMLATSHIWKETHIYACVADTFYEAL